MGSREGLGAGSTPTDLPPLIPRPRSLGNRGSRTLLVAAAFLLAAGFCRRASGLVEEGVGLDTLLHPVPGAQEVQLLIELMEID